MDFIVSKGAELNVFQTSKVMYITADGNYSHIHTTDGRAKLVSMRLGELEKLIDSQLFNTDIKFLRVGRGLIVHSMFVSGIDLKHNKLVVTNGIGKYIEHSASHEALLNLKQFFENKILDK